MNIKMDFLTDWQNIMVNEILEKGLKFSPHTKIDSLVIRYFTYLRKVGGEAPVPRRVHKSKEFVCPPEHNAGLEKLIEVLREGRDISPYLSKMVDNISKTDGMFNDWGVLHLHLGVRPDPKDSRYVERDDSLLFLYLMPQDAYLINIYEHGDWTDKTILQTAIDNWPELIEPYIIKGALSLRGQYTEKEHQAMRDAGLTVFIELKNKNGDTIVIAPPGLGITQSKDSLQDVRSYHAQIHLIRNIEKFVQENPDIFQQAFNGKVPDPMELKLVYKNERWIIVEQLTGAEFNIIDR